MTTDFGELFATTVRQNPDAIALVAGESSLSFSELARVSDGRGSELANILDRSPSSHLPLLVDGSLESVVAVFSCIRFQIPCGLIDGLAPQGRIQQLVGMWGAEGVGWAGPDVPPDSIPEAWKTSPQPDHISAGAISPRSETLVITTSGSTGFPKGVVLSFRSLVERLLIDLEREEYSVQPAVISNFSPIHFIGGINRILKVFAGHRVVLFNPMTLTPRGMLQELQRAEVTHLHWPPQLARLLAEYRNSDGLVLNAVRSLRMGSEGIRFETLHGLKKFFPQDVVFSHGLGATEMGPVIHGRFLLSEAPAEGQVPLGVPQERVLLSPVDGFAEECHEVWATGPIAEEYLGQPNLTAERFALHEDRRYWKSGDLVSIGQDGLYYHRGRMDDVVKVRGMLASPSETTRALLGVPGVKTAVTLPFVSHGNTRLVSHVEVGYGKSGLDERSLMKELGAVLPDHLLPLRITLHEKLPTTPRGKIDRVALMGHPGMTGQDSRASD